MRSLEQGGEQSLLAGALITHGTSLARVHSTEAAFATLKRGMTVAEQAGDPDSAGIAALTIVEELAPYVPYAELHEYYLHAESLLARSQHLGVRTRLGECARKILTNEKRFEGLSRLSFHNGQKLARSLGIIHAATFSWNFVEDQVLNFEADLIRQALEPQGKRDARGPFTGNHPSGLAFILNGRHKSFLSIRTTPV